MFRADQGRFLDYIVSWGNLTEEKVALYLRDILEALQYLHGWRIAHLDLKVNTYSYLTAHWTAVLVFKLCRNRKNKSFKYNLCPEYVPPFPFSISLRTLWWNMRPPSQWWSWQTSVMLFNWTLPPPTSIRSWEAQSSLPPSWSWVSLPLWCQTSGA